MKQYSINLYLLNLQINNNKNQYLERKMKRIQTK